MKDNPPRIIIKRLAALRYAAEIGVRRWWRRLRGRRYYRLGGHCIRCGKCCTSPVIEVYPMFFHLAPARLAIVFWHRIINGFVYIGENRKRKQFIFRCSHLDPETGTCDSYLSRPGLCRDYPRNLLDTPAPQMLDGCGYYPLLAKAEKMAVAIDGIDMPEDVRDRLKSNLGLQPPQPPPGPEHKQ